MRKKLHEKYDFRSIKVEETDQAVCIEHICFPPNEACSREHMTARILKAAECFLVAVDKKTGLLAGFINGLATDEISFRDEFFTDENLHKAGGKSIMVVGLDVLPEHRGQGLGRELVEEYFRLASENNRERIVLTCLEEKIAMYEKFGFSDLGEANSTWGGEKWHEMVYTL